MKYIDIHCHLNMDKFDLDYEDAILRAKEKEVGMIVVGIDLPTSKKAIEIAEKHQNIWATIGLHPTDTPHEVFEKEEYLKLAQHPKVVAVGECGLEYYRQGYETREKQKEIFEAHIAIANEVKKPLMLHIRNGIKPEENAYADALEILRKHAKVPGDVHFFAGTVEDGRHFIDLGFRLSFTGVITFTRDYDEVIKNIPLNMILSETDSPFVAPVPYRGQRNEPAYVVEVVHKIAEIREENIEKVSSHLIDNARKLFSI